MEARPRVVIYTDGACEPNPGPGGWAALLRFGAHEKTLSGRHPATTNNRMELTAAVQALQALDRPCRVELYTEFGVSSPWYDRWLPAGGSAVGNARVVHWPTRSCGRRSKRLKPGMTSPGIGSTATPVTTITSGLTAWHARQCAQLPDFSLTVCLT